MIRYIVTSRQDAIARTGSPYVNLKIASIEEGNTTICVFDVSKTMGPRVGQVVQFKNIRDYQDKKSATNNDMIVSGEPIETDPLYNLIPRPIKRKDWDDCVDHLCEMCHDEALTEIIRTNAATLFDLYIQYPAATSVHHAFPGGLLNHTYQMLHMLEGIYPTIPYHDDMKIERCILAIMYHDWGKTREYTPDGECTKYMYLLGHIYMSSQMLQNVLNKAGIDKEEINLIVHCVLAHHGELEYGSPVKPATQEAQLVNYLDNISAKADIFNSTGNLEKSFALGTHVVK